MEQTRKKPITWLLLATLVLALLAASRLPANHSRPVCAEMSAAQPGFAALQLGPIPACIRIHLR